MIHASGRGHGHRYSIAIVITLATGIAMATALFPLFVDVILPEGWFGGEQIVSIMAEHPGLGVRTSVPLTTFEAWEGRLGCCDPLVGLVVTDSVMRLASGAVSVRSAQVGDGFFALTGVTPVAGSALSRIEGVEDARLTLVVQGFARTHFGGVAEAVGEQIVVDGEPALIVGVLPDGFGRALHLDETVDIVQRLDASEPKSVLVFGRLRQGVTRRQAQAELSTWVTSRPRAADKDGAQRWVVLSWKELIDSNTRRMLDVAWIAGLVLLVVTSANIAHLLAARTEEQRQDFVIRWALGATPWAQMKWQMREILTLTAAAGLGAAVLAGSGLKLLIAVVPENLRILTATVFDPGTFAFGLIASFVMLFCFGTLPNFLRTAGALSSGLRTDSRLGSQSRWGKRFGAIHVMTMVGAAFVLVVIATLLLVSVLNLRRIDPGFEAHGLQAIHLERPERTGREPRDIFVSTFIERLSALPGADSVAMASQPPPGSGIYLGEIRLGSSEGPNRSLMGAAMTFVGPGYFHTLRQKIIAGREFSEQDVRSKALVVIASETLARHLDSDPRNALGREVWLDGERFTLVGIVADLNAPEFLKPFGKLQLYRPLTETGWSTSVLVRSRQDLTRVVRTIANTLGPDVVVETSTLEGRFWDSLTSIGFLTAVLSFLVLVVLGLAVTGVYGVFSSYASRQTGQIAVRMMLGAHQEDVKRLMLIEGTRVSLVGVLVGGIASYPVSDLVAGHLFGLGPHSLSVRLASAAVVLATALTAVWIPAVRAGRTDPGEVLRTS